MLGRDAFAAGLRERGIEPDISRPGDLLSFPFVIANGPRAGEVLEVGLEVPPNWPIEPPHGPCYRPAILRGMGRLGVHEDRYFGPGWDHWSRPHPRWADTGRTVADYLRHLRTLNEELTAPQSVPVESDAA